MYNFAMKLIILSCLLFSHYTYAKTLTLGASEWCPYTCSSMQNNGIITEFITQLLKKKGIETKVIFLPWHRAIEMSRVGKIDGIITGVYEEAPHLDFTKTPTMEYQSCIYSATNQSKKVTFRDLRKYKIGVIDSYSYGKKIDRFLSSLKEGKQKVLVRGQNAIQRLKKLADSERIDYFVEDINVVNFHIGSGVNPALCGEKNPFFFGLNRELRIKKDILSFLDKEIKQNRKKLDDIIAKNKKKYNLNLVN